jgi:hypothetical protein
MFTAGTTVKGGCYLNRDQLDLVVVSGPQGTLPGRQRDRYLRIPAPAMLVLAPVLGGLFVVFVPLAGFVLVLKHLGRSRLGRRRAP